MDAEGMKSRSRGISRDMSPQAISKRFDILVELHDVAVFLSDATRIGKAPRSGAVATRSTRPARQGH